jgi:hypothetical protein
MDAQQQVPSALRSLVITWCLARLSVHIRRTFLPAPRLSAVSATTIEPRARDCNSDWDTNRDDNKWFAGMLPKALQTPENVSLLKRIA